MKKPLKEKRTKLELFFKAIQEADPEDQGLYSALFNPYAYSHWRTFNAVVAQEVHEQMAGDRFYEEYKPEIQKIVAMATAATIDLISERYHKERLLHERRKR